MKKNILIYYLLTVFIFSSSSLVLALSPEDIRMQEEEYRKQLKYSEQVELSGEGQFLYDYGGWISHQYFQLHNDDNNSVLGDNPDYYNETDLRLWLRVAAFECIDNKMKEGNSLYARLKTKFTTWPKPMLKRLKIPALELPM